MRCRTYRGKKKERKGNKNNQVKAVILQRERNIPKILAEYSSRATFANRLERLK
jgi:hypothetical protein